MAQHRLVHDIEINDADLSPTPDLTDASLQQSRVQRSFALPV